MAPPDTDDTPGIPASAAADLCRRLEHATALLESVVTDRALLAVLDDAARQRLIRAAGDVFCPDVPARRKLARAMVRQRQSAAQQRDDAVLDATGIRRLRRKPVYTTPDYVLPPPDTTDEPAREVEARHCYICKQPYTTVHHFYDQLCPPCAALNLHKRSELADLTGRVALVTGGRVKIGYQAVIKLLRAGAHVVVTTRFPRDSAARYAAEADFATWGHRLDIYGLDLRHTPSVEGFCRHLASTLPRLDFLVNNACQTVRRPPAFYQHMLDREAAASTSLSAPAGALLGDFEGLRAAHLPDSAEAVARAVPFMAMAGMTDAAALSQVALIPDDVASGAAQFPRGRLDQDLQQVDLRDHNSWRLRLDEVAAVELLEVHLVNAVAPFLLNARLKPLLLATPERDKHIVNVSAVEGQFYRRFKTTRHPHTNMAKAALNMMTRTAAADYHADGIHMNSVDTGWVTDEDPAELAARKAVEQRFHPPLDIVDGAARIVDPIISGFNTGRHVWGQFLKDYRPTHW